ncbi:MAG: CoA-binding protein [Bacteroidales bacterium]|nr:CoA-binding protein [Bacteroidales bacterium]
MKTLKQINDFIESQPIAMAGVSRNPKKFGYAAFKELKDKGMKIIPVNPSAEEILGEKAYPVISELPDGIKGLIIMTKKDQTAALVREAKNAGIKRIWIQQNSDSKEALAELKDTDISYITGECILMHYKPNGIHKFHRAINRFFGILPK